MRRSTFTRSVMRSVAVTVSVVSALLHFGAPVQAQQWYMEVPDSFPGTYSTTTHSRILGPWGSGTLREDKHLEYMWGMASQPWSPWAFNHYTTQLETLANHAWTANDLSATPSNDADAEQRSLVALARAIRFTANGWQTSDLYSALAACEAAKLQNTLNSDAKVEAAKIATNYILTYDLIKPWLSSQDREDIEDNFMSSGFRGKMDYPSNQVHNKQQICAAARGLLALVIQDSSHTTQANADLDQALDKLNESYGETVSAAGWHTDGARYLNYTVPELLPFAIALHNASSTTNIDDAIETFASFTVNTRLPNGLQPNVHNSDHMPVPLGTFAQMVSDPDLAAACMWYHQQLVANFAWGSNTNILVNHTNSPHLQFLLTDNSINAAAPNWSPTFLSDRSADVGVMRNDWSSSSNYMMLHAGKDGTQSYNWDQYDTGEVYFCANGTPILVGMGYAPSGASGNHNSDSTPVTSLYYNGRKAEYKNLLLARDGGSGGNFGVGGNGRTNTPDSVTTWMTNRHDGQEVGQFDPTQPFKGAADFCTLKAAYRGSGEPGKNVNNERSIAHLNEDYFVIADTFTDITSGNKDYAFHLMGKGDFNEASVSDPQNYRRVSWNVTDYDAPHWDGNQIFSQEYTDANDGKLHMHLMSTHPMVNGSVAGLDTEEFWHTDNTTRRISATRYAAWVDNVPNGGGFLAVLEPQASGSQGSNYVVTDECTTNYAGAMVDFMQGAMPDWWCDSILSQDSQVLRSLTRLQSDAKFAYVRQETLVWDIFNTGNPIMIPCVFPNSAFMAAGTQMGISILGGPYQTFLTFPTLTTVSVSLDRDNAVFVMDTSPEAMFRVAQELDEENPVFEDDPWEAKEARIWVGRVETPAEYVTVNGEDVEWQYDEEAEEIVFTIEDPGKVFVQLTDEVMNYWAEYWALAEFDPEVHEWEEYPGEG